MKSLAHILIAVQDIANEFNGSFALKNAQGKYFYANESWLKLVGMTNTELMEKTDDDLFPPENADFIRQTDHEALQKGNLVEYTNTILLHGEEITYVALKWVVRHKTGDVFCYCTLGDLVEKKDQVMEVLPKIQQLLESQFSEADLD